MRKLVESKGEAKSLKPKVSELENVNQDIVNNGKKSAIFIWKALFHSNQFQRT